MLSVESGHRRCSWKLVFREALSRQNLRFRLRTSLVPPKYWLSEVVVADLLIVSSCSRRRSAKTEAKILTQILHFSRNSNCTEVYRLARKVFESGGRALYSILATVARKGSENGQ